MTYEEQPSQQGFAVVEALLIIVVIGLIAGVGYWVFKQRSANHAPVANTPISATQPKDAKTTQGFSELESTELDSADKTNDTAATNYGSAAQSDNSAANNVGDAYNEKNY